MRRMLFNFAAAVSLLLCVGTVGLWVRASLLNKEDAVFGTIRGCEWHIASFGGQINVGTTSDYHTKWFGWTTNENASSTDFFLPIGFREWNYLGVDVIHGTFEILPPSLLRHRSLIAPQLPTNSHYVWFAQSAAWKAAILFGFLPALIFGTRIIRHRLRRDTSGRACLACSYNLTGNTSGVCPECGTPVPLNHDCEPRPHHSMAQKNKMIAM